jgi:hypothetical protein
MSVTAKEKCVPSTKQEKWTRKAVNSQRRGTQHVATNLEMGQKMGQLRGGPRKDPLSSTSIDVTPAEQDLSTTECTMPWRRRSLPSLPPLSAQHLAEAVSVELNFLTFLLVMKTLEFVSSPHRINSEYRRERHMIVGR